MCGAEITISDLIHEFAEHINIVSVSACPVINIEHVQCSDIDYHALKKFMHLIRTPRGRRTTDVVRKEIQELENLMKGVLPTVSL